jgi:hypothetical protein
MTARGPDQISEYSLPGVHEPRLAPQSSHCKATFDSTTGHPTLRPILNYAIPDESNAQQG